VPSAQYTLLPFTYREREIALSQQRARALVIVESPTKAKTISKYLGSDYRVVASMGHVRDLPSSASEIPASVKKKSWARIGVNVDEDFEPLYVIPPDKKRHIQELKALLKDADELYIATDEDREGESIGWHLIEVLKPKVPTKRMVFHEITQDAIMRALSNTRTLDVELVRAQEARRVLDRLVGYVVSPLLWKKVAPRLSAGRVQSAAVKVLVERERLRMAFVSGSWWDLKATLEVEGQTFNATLSKVADRQIATSAQFDPNTGALKLGKEHLLLDEAHANKLCASVLPIEGAVVTVEQLDRKSTLKAPPPPFITSTLQQETNKRWGWSASQTMKVAQRLYESGYITYMRTDAPALAEEAVKGIRTAIKARFGESSMPKSPKRYSSRSKGAQEAHEAIRPSGTEMREASELKLKDQEARLYTLIWQRTMACQMTPAELSHTTAYVSLPSKEGTLELRASGRELLKRGFLAVYEQKDNADSPLPPLEEGRRLTLTALSPEGHQTRAPARFSEATLVKALESEGIGRPSTYASIIDTIQRRGYVRAQGRQLTPTFTALAVTQLLEQAFSDIVDLEFTASMEGWLDEIATGESHTERLRSFYDQQLLSGVSRGEQLDPREICAITGPHFEGYEVRVGRFGPFIEHFRGEARSTISLPEEVSPDEVTADWILEQVSRAEAGEQPLGESEEGEPIYVKTGRYGPYIQLGDGEKPKRSSLPPGVEPDQVTLDQARYLLTLPRGLGQDSEGNAISLGLGRFGPYVHVKKTYASLKPSDDFFNITLERALELIQDKQSSTKGRADALRVLGEHPDGGEISVFDGRYGPYVKHGKINASLPKDQAVDSLTLELALELIAKRAATVGKKKSSAKATKTAKTAKATTTKATKPKTTKATKPKTTQTTAKTRKTATKAKKST